MKLYSDTLTREDLYDCLPADVDADVQNINNPRKRKHGYEVRLVGLGDRHTRKTNSGNYGAGDRMAATWDDHGIWMAALYEIDPLAIIATYQDRDRFYESTRDEHEWRRNSARPYRSTAPWLDKVEA